jgi:hypothetical protein
MARETTIPPLADPTRREIPHRLARIGDREFESSWLTELGAVAALHNRLSDPHSVRRFIRGHELRQSSTDCFHSTRLSRHRYLEPSRQIGKIVVRSLRRQGFGEVAFEKAGEQAVQHAVGDAPSEANDNRSVATDGTASARPLLMTASAMTRPASSAGSPSPSRRTSGPVR